MFVKIAECPKELKRLVLLQYSKDCDLKGLSESVVEVFCIDCLIQGKEKLKTVLHERVWGSGEAVPRGIKMTFTLEKTL